MGDVKNYKTETLCTFSLQGCAESAYELKDRVEKAQARVAELEGAIREHREIFDGMTNSSADDILWELLKEQI